MPAGLRGLDRNGLDSAVGIATTTQDRVSIAATSIHGSIFRCVLSQRQHSFMPAVELYRDRHLSRSRYGCDC